MFYKTCARWSKFLLCHYEQKFVFFFLGSVNQIKKKIRKKVGVLYGYLHHWVKLLDFYYIFNETFPKYIFKSIDMPFNFEMFSITGRKSIYLSMLQIKLKTISNNNRKSDFFTVFPFFLLLLEKWSLFVQRFCAVLYNIIYFI